MDSRETAPIVAPFLVRGAASPPRYLATVTPGVRHGTDLTDATPPVRG